jgi:hypothetical protein
MSNWVNNGGVVPQLTTRNGGIAPPPPTPSPTPPPSTVQTVSNAPVAPPALPSPSSLKPQTTTAKEIRDYFRNIQGSSDPTLTPGDAPQKPIESPPPPQDPGGR